MNILFVTPSQVSSGEAVTALCMAEWLSAEGCRVHFLASEFTAGFIGSQLGDRVSKLGAELKANQRTWQTTLEKFRPAAVVFADYPLLAFGSGTVPLRDAAWENNLEQVEASLFTLDHLGYAQRSRIVFFGPASATLGLENIPSIPARMRVLLPCPLHDPHNSGLHGSHFQYWNHRPAPDKRDLSDARAPYLRSADELILLHLTSQWACQAAERLQHPYYSVLPEMLSAFLTDFGLPVTILSINNGSLLPQTESERVRVINARPTDPGSFERLLLACDLVITENRISVSLGKAICQMRPCAILRNSNSIREIVEGKPGSARLWAEKMERARFGSVFPFDVFPIWSRVDLEELGIFDDTCLHGAFAAVEVFGDETAKQQFQNLLADTRTREAMRAAQEEYLRRVRELPTPREVLNDPERQGYGQMLTRQPESRPA